MRIAKKRKNRAKRRSRKFLFTARSLKIQMKARTRKTRSWVGWSNPTLPMSISYFTPTEYTARMSSCITSTVGDPTGFYFWATTLPP